MPVAFAASLGGTVSLVGTPPNGIINSMLAQTGQTPFGFFEFGLIGVPLLAAGLIYYALIGHRFLPDRQPVDDDVVTEGAQHRRENKMWHAMIIFAFVVFMMASELMPLTTAAMLGACLMIITGCMTMREAFRSVDWTTIFLFAGMLSMSAAMDKSGAAAHCGQRRGEHGARPLDAHAGLLRAHGPDHQLHVQHGHGGPYGPSGPAHRHGQRHFSLAHSHGHCHVRFLLLPDAHRHAAQYHCSGPRPLFLYGLRQGWLAAAGYQSAHVLAAHSAHLAFPLGRVLYGCGRRLCDAGPWENNKTRQCYEGNSV